MIEQNAGPLADPLPDDSSLTSGPPDGLAPAIGDA